MKTSDNKDNTMSNQPYAHFHSPLKLSELIDIIKSNKQVFLTGAAGTGKSHTVRLLKQYFRNPVILSSTHKSANLLGGSADTVHHFFSLGICKSLDELNARDRIQIDKIVKSMSVPNKIAVRMLYKGLNDVLSRSELIVIDEISMISSQVLDMIYKRLKDIKQIFPDTTLPHILFTGDLFQLPPINRGSNLTDQISIQHSPYFKPKIITLFKNHRTENQLFQTALAYIRIGKYTRTVAEVIEMIQKNKFNPNAVTVVSRNDIADQINMENINKLKSKLHTIKADTWFHQSVKGTETENRILKDTTTPQTLNIKVGARIIFTVTHSEKLYYNGQQGTITEIRPDYIAVKLDSDNTELMVTKFKHTKYQIKVVDGIPVETLIFEMHQFPITLAYAITTHKSQGMSIESFNIDCSMTFGKAMFYVALSRGTDPKKIHIRNFDYKFVKMPNTEAEEYFKRLDNKILKVSEIIDDISEPISIKELK